MKLFLAVSVAAALYASAFPPKYQSTVYVSVEEYVTCTPEEVADDCIEGQRRVGHGSGFVIDSKHIATAKHVAAVKDGRSFVIIDSLGRKHTATDVEIWKNADFAILTLDVPLTVKPAKVACGKVQTGERLYVVGFPLELGPMIFELTAVNYIKSDEDGVVLLATGVSLPGNSGGPVFNARGEVVGILIGEFQYGSDFSMVDSDVNIITPAPTTLCQWKAAKK